MLSIGKVGLSRNQQLYYEQQVARGAEDYYAGRGEAPGRWVGAGAELLGLEGDLDPDQLTALMDGKDPDTGAQLAVRSGRCSTAALDLTFSAPKSVSVLFAIGNEELSEMLVKAHEGAVGAALGYMEREACRVRRGPQGVRKERAAGFVAAAYSHRMSRAQDPQLHTHVVVANMAQGEDGRWTALDGRPIYEHAKAAGCLYEAHLRVAVIERLPWASWGMVREGIAELEQVPEAVREEFSQRRRRILERERELEAAGVTVGRAGRERIVFDTREPKREALEEEWRIEMRARAAEHGLGQREFEQLMRLGLTRKHESVSERELAQRLFAASGLTARRNTFRRRDLLIGLASEHGQGASVSDLVELAERLLAHEDVVQLDRGMDARFTTQELLAAEERIVAHAEQGLRAGACVADGLALAAAVRGLPVRLSVEQEHVVAAISRSGNRIDVVEALAGTGKTTCAAALRAIYERAGHRVIGAAPTARAVRELRDRAGIEHARTLDGWAVRLASNPHALVAEPSQAPGALSTVLVVDEAGMASTRLAAEVIDRAMADQVKVVAIGDSGQLSSVQAGGWLGALSRRVGSLELREVMRQRDPHERRGLAEVHRGVPGGYLRLKESRGELTVFAGDEAGLEAEQRLVAAWDAARERYGQAHAVMICRDNARRERLNDLARACLREQGKLGPPTAVIGKEWAVGDRVIARRNDRALDVDNGMRGTIIQVGERDGATVRLDAGGTRRLGPDYLAQHVEPAYAVTAHGMQGATVQWAGVIGPPQDFSRNWAYTALSRAREPTEIFLVDGPSRAEQERAEIAPREREADRTDALERMARRMRERDDENLALEQQDHDLPSHARPGPAHEEARGAEQLSRVDGGDGKVSERAVSPERERVHRIRRERDAVREQLRDPDIEIARSIERLQDWMVGMENEQRFDARPRGWRDRKAHRHRTAARQDRLAEWHEQEAELRERVADPKAVLERAEQLQQEVQRLSEESWRARDEAVEAELAGRPPWLEATLGPEPDDRRGKERWQETARQIAAHRIDHDITDPHIAIDEHGARLSLTRSIEKTRTALGLEIDDHGHEVDGYGF